MKPEPFLLGNIGESDKVVNRTGVGRPGRPNDANRLMTVATVPRDCRLQGFKINLVEVIDRQQAERIRAHAQNGDTFWH